MSERDRSAAARPRRDRAPLAESAASPRPNARAGEAELSDQIARRAYELYERRGREHGRDWDDWFQAERELRRV